MPRPHRSHLFTALAATLALAATASAQRRPVTHEDVWCMRRLSPPALSPDGGRVVFAVTEPAYDPDATVTDLWVARTAAPPAARRLTTAPGSEGDVVWNAQGTAIAFVAKRDGDDEPQVYVLDMTAPGEARRVTAAPAGARNPQWSPDGRWLAYESPVDPAHDAGSDEDAMGEVRASAYDGFPVRYWNRWLDQRQVHLFVQPLEEPGAARDLLAGTELVRASGFSAQPGLSGDSLHAVWTPDGDELVFVATTERDRAAFAPVRYHLYRTAAGGDATPRRVTDDDAGSEGDPWFQPDTGRLFFLRRPVNDWVYNHAELRARDWAQDRDLGAVAAGLDRPIEGFTAVGDDIWLVATEHGRRRVFRCRLGDDAPPRLLDPQSRGVHAGLVASRDGVLVSRWEDSTHPAEIVRVEPEGGALRPLTSLNRERAAALDRQPFREFWFDSDKGRRVHCWLALPPGFDEDGDYPLLTWMHGGPHSSCLDADHVRWSPHLLAAPGYVVVMVDYTGSVGYGQDFARAIQGDPLQTPGDELLQAARVAAERFPFVDASRQAALGASYGGHLANWMQATTDHFRCLVGHAGLVSLEGQWATSDVIFHREQNLGGPPWQGDPVWQQQSPHSHAANFATPMLLTIGERDYRVPLNQTLAAWSYLQRRQVPSRLLVFHDAGHWVMRGPDARYYWQQVHAWLAQHLQGGDAPR